MGFKFKFSLVRRELRCAMTHRDSPDTEPRWYATGPGGVAFEAPTRDALLQQLRHYARGLAAQAGCVGGAVLEEVPDPDA